MTDPAIRTRIQVCIDRADPEMLDFWLMHDSEDNEFCLCWPPGAVT